MNIKTNIPFQAVFLGLFLLVSVNNLNAQGLKVAYVDADKILVDAPQGQLALKKLAAEFAPRDKKISELSRRLEKIKQDFARKLQSLSKAGRRRQGLAIGQLERRLARSKQELREDYNWRRNEELANLQKIVALAIAAVADEEGLHLIIDNVVYVSTRVDVTKKVLSKLAQQVSKNSLQNK
ncbi:OmpH family outer membrane protein [Pseudomonadota bacterium]